MDKTRGKSATKISYACGHSSVVERNLAKVDVARSNRVARLKLLVYVRQIFKIFMPPSSRGLGQLPFTEQTGIRVPLGVLHLF
jgi:hypothetical protein